MSSRLYSHYLDSGGDEESFLAGLIQGEAGNQPEEGRRAVAGVLQNRASQNFGGHGTSPIEQALAPHQFQGWQPPDETSRQIAQDLLTGKLENPVPGALYYANPKFSTAKWAKKLNAKNSIKIGDHFFSDNIKGEPFSIPGRTELAKVEPQAPGGHEQPSPSTQVAHGAESTHVLHPQSGKAAELSPNNLHPVYRQYTTVLARSAPRQGGPAQEQPNKGRREKQEQQARLIVALNALRPQTEPLAPAARIEPPKPPTPAAKTSRGAEGSRGHILSSIGGIIGALAEGKSKNKAPPSKPEHRPIPIPPGPVLEDTNVA